MKEYRVQRALVDLARRGDEEAFADLARGVGDRLMAIAFRILRDVDRAEDAVQQTLMTAWRELPSLREDDRFDAWLRRILVHACYAEAKRRRTWAANIRILPTDGPAARDDTSWGCRSPRSPMSSASLWGPSSPASITPERPFGRRSTPTPGHRP